MTPSDDVIPVNKLLDLTDKVAIVTGGAIGIGFAVSYRLAEAGASVLIIDTNDQGAQEASRKIAGHGYRASSLRCDVRLEADVRGMAQTAVEKLGGIDILVNNAGIYPRMPLAQTTGSDFEQVVSVNLTGTFLCSREVSQKMIEQKRSGRIINIVSIEAIHPVSTGLSAYDASKGAVMSLTKSLALELGKYDIRVNAIAPGGIITEGVRSVLSKQSAAEGKAQLKALMARVLLGRMGEADDIARVALFLASDLASYMTGSLVVVDGGYLVS